MVAIPTKQLIIRNLLGFLDGQTTNPTLVAKNPEVQQRIASGHKLSFNEQKQEYKKIVQSILVASLAAFELRVCDRRMGPSRRGSRSNGYANLHGDKEIAC
jgi:hypothetical protein